MQSLRGKVVVVTGASKGLGNCLARALDEAECSVALVARASEDLTSLASQLSPRSRAFCCNVRSAEDVKKSFAEILRVYGRIDALINNAATVQLNPFENAPDNDVMAELETNFLGPIWCTRAVIPAMKAQGSGDIINISSESVHMPMPFLTIYAATKGGLETLSRGLRSELQDDGIRVMIFRSGFMQEMKSAASWRDDVKAEFYQRLQATGVGRYSGKGVHAAVSAKAIVDLLRLDQQANVDFMELRSSQ